MNTPTDGGPVYPEIINIEAKPVKDLDRQERLVHLVATRGGMSLRDWFAGQVLIGLSVMRGDRTNEHDAAIAYGLADAMLKERDKR